MAVQYGPVLDGLPNKVWVRACHLRVALTVLSKVLCKETQRERTCGFSLAASTKHSKRIGLAGWLGRRDPAVYGGVSRHDTLQQIVTLRERQSGKRVARPSNCTTPLYSILRYLVRAFFAL